MILYWWSATWCKPCEKMIPIIDELIKETGWTLEKIDVTTGYIPPEIRSVPAFKLNGKYIFGATTKEKLKNLL